MTQLHFTRLHGIQSDAKEENSHTEEKLIAYLDQILIN